MEKEKVLTVLVFALMLLNIATLSYLFFRGPSFPGLPPEPPPPPAAPAPPMAPAPPAPPPPPVPPVPPPPPPLEAALEMTEEQFSFFDRLKAEYRANIRALEDSFFLTVSEYFGLLRRTPTDDARRAEEAARFEAEAARLEAELARLEAEKVRVTFEHFQTLQEVLTPEQREKFNVILPELVDRMAPTAVAD